ncbi:protein arginine kinase [Candidatus Latescibacterota bacterium]
MSFKSIIHSIPEWLSTDGPESGIVISSRTRLARNISGMLYAHHSEEDKLGDVVNNVIEAAENSGYNSKDFFLIKDLDDSQRNIFIERHLISPALASDRGNRGILVLGTECSSVMINEEDHLRLQSLRAGFDPMGALENVMEIENKLSSSISFSFSDEYGYLTACPTNMGTGLRASVLIHLPALVITKEMQRVIRSASQLGMAVRGFRGEGSDVVGNLFQISNQTSLGKTEHEIVQGIISVVNQIIDYEKKAAGTLLKDAEKQILDKIFRSLGILKTARVLSTHEFMNLSSVVRLGLHLGIIDKPEIISLNELMILTQPGHLQERIGKQIEPVERDVIRADFVRERFIDVKV